MVAHHTPQSASISISSFDGLANAVIRAFNPACTISEIASLSSLDTAGIPASISGTPISSSFLAMLTLSSFVNTTPACCSPSRKVQSTIDNF